MSNNLASPNRTRRLALLAVFVGLGFAAFVPIQAEPAEAPEQETGDGLNSAEMLIEYYHEMSSPKPFLVRAPQDFDDHRRELKEKVLESVGLSPLPERIPLDVHESEPLDHPWCTVRRVYYRLWPGVYSTALLYMPKTLPQRPAPAMLSAHGHWKDGSAHPEVQKRCLNFARLGYVTLASTQNHYENLYCGVSDQTLMIWTNMRAVDYLESLPEVDKSRIGVAGASGGGLQTQMLAALDTRVKAATVVGLTCDFRRIMFPERHHCTCNHFPRVMQFTDHPEISALALPTPLQFLTMNDWTRQFEEENLPTLEALYAANGFPDCIDCKYYDTPHSYDRAKRERTYGWMERWVRGGESAEAVAEPEAVETFPVETLAALSVDVPGDKGFDEIGRIYRQERGYSTPSIDTSAQWRAYRDQMLGHLRHLLGEHAVLARRVAEPRTSSTSTEQGLLVEHVAYPSEGGILVPTIVLRSQSAGGKLPVVVFCGEPDREAMLEVEGPDSPRARAQQGALVAIPDVRCYGELFATKAGDETRQRKAWERNGIVWGRPVAGMAATDLRAVLDGLAARGDADPGRISLLARNSAGLAAAVLFTAALDARVTSADIDLEGCCFENRKLPLVSCILQHGDVLEWSALLADRTLILRNLPREAGSAEWLTALFGLLDNEGGLKILSPPTGRHAGR